MKKTLKLLVTIVLIGFFVTGCAKKGVKLNTKVEIPEEKLIITVLDSEIVEIAKPTIPNGKYLKVNVSIENNSGKTYTLSLANFKVGDIAATMILERDALRETIRKDDTVTGYLYFKDIEQIKGVLEYTSLNNSEDNTDSNIYLFNIK